jgi:heat shock protein HtpX
MYEQISSNKRRTVFLLFFFIVILWGLAWLISQATGRPGLLFVIGLFSLLYSVFSYFAGAKIALAVNGAKEISKKDDPRLWRTVENLAITEGLPMPKVYIMNDPAPNAFATGRNHDKAAVCATSGLLDMMNDTELEGVIAHELDMFWHISLFGGNDEDSPPWLRILAIVAVILAPIAATLLQLAISRRREYLADATGALSTRYPDGLASALEKIGSFGSALKKPNTATAHMFFANPLKAGVIAGLFSTHPPIEARIKALHEMRL